MKSITVFLLAALTILVMGGNAFADTPAKPAEKKLEHGFVQIYDFGAMKLHAYQTSDAMLDECFVLETGKNLVAVESPPFDVNIAEWKQYIASLGKPLTDILISAHPGGGNWYGQAKSHATASAAKAIGSGGTKALTDSLGQAFGAGFNTDMPKIDVILKAGTNTISGITFEIIDAGDSYDIVVPGINVIYTHMLGADTHSILAGKEHISAVLASLESMQAKGYALILSSHHTPETQADVAAKIADVTKVRELAAQSSNKDDFVARVKKEFPDYAGLNYLDMTAGYFFPDK